MSLSCQEGPARWGEEEAVNSHHVAGCHWWERKEREARETQNDKVTKAISE